MTRVALPVATRRLARGRVRRLAPAPHRTGDRDGRGSAPTVGRALAGLAGVTMVLVAGPVGVAAFALTVVVARRHRSTRRALRERDAVRRELPELIEVLAMAASAGCTVPLALDVAARHGPPACRASIAALVRRCDRGARLADELAALPAVMGDGVRPLVALLLDAIRYGSPLVPALERAALEARIDRRRTAEESARRLPVLLLLPLVTCVLPAAVILAVVPLVAGALGSLH